MRVPNIFLIVLFTVLLAYSTIAQTFPDISTSWTFADETSLDPTTQPPPPPPPPTTTTPIPTSAPTTCKYPEEFPLFSNDVCISRAAYTAIFLTSIILAGISFLMLLGFLILYCIRHSKNSGSSYTSDDESNMSRGSKHRKSYSSETSTMNKRGGQHTAVLQNVAGTSPLEQMKPNGTNPPPFVSRYTGGDNQAPASASSAPYTDGKPVAKQTITTQQRIVTENPPETYEMTSRQTSIRPANTPRSQPSSAPKTAARQDDRRGRSRTKTTPSTEETETSYF